MESCVPDSPSSGPKPKLYGILASFHLAYEEGSSNGLETRPSHDRPSAYCSHAKSHRPLTRLRRRCRGHWPSGLGSDAGRIEAWMLQRPIKVRGGWHPCQARCPGQRAWLELSLLSPSPQVACQWGVPTARDRSRSCLSSQLKDYWGGARSSCHISQR
ncbi:hypothetical protein GQ53DRAFT_421606 [Thozetella sp. PMI_491]|nr:hypothetical protein GQ53DRAFT_421606 [Thozetella sp. PMI_491]